MTDELSARLRKACNGHPNAEIPWPHRILHEAADELDRLRQQLAERGEPVALPNRRVNMPHPDEPGNRIVGFVLEPGDPALGEYGLSEPLEWLNSLGATPPAQSAVPEGWRDKLWAVHSALDSTLGDSDIDWVEDDAELRSEEPVQWAAKELAQLLSAAPSAGEAQGDPLLQARQDLALAYSGGALYGDDGELSDCAARPFIDFRRDSFSEIGDKLRRRAEAQGDGREAWPSFEQLVEWAKGWREWDVPDTATTEERIAYGICRCIEAGIAAQRGGESS